MAVRMVAVQKIESRRRSGNTMTSGGLRGTRQSPDIPVWVQPGCNVEPLPLQFDLAVMGLCASALIKWLPEKT